MRSAILNPETLYLSLATSIVFVLSIHKIFRLEMQQIWLNIYLLVSSFKKAVKGDSASFLTHCLITATMISYFVEVRKSSRAAQEIKEKLFENTAASIERLREVRKYMFGNRYNAAITSLDLTASPQVVYVRTCAQKGCSEL